MKSVTKLTGAFLLLAGTAAAQMTITNVTNAGSRPPRTSPFGGIAQRALFVVTGRGAITTRKSDGGNAAFGRYPNLPASSIGVDYLYPEISCSINGYPGPNGGVLVNGTEVAVVPQMSVAVDAGLPWRSRVPVARAPSTNESI